MGKVVSFLFAVLFASTILGATQTVLVSNNDSTVQFLSNDFAVPASNVVVLQNQLQSWQDVAATLFLAKVTKMSPERIVSLRQGGMSFAGIANRFHVSPSVFVVPGVDFGTVVVSGPPFGRALGHRPKVINLTDEELENRIIVLRTSRHFNVPVATEAKLVASGTPFTTIIVNHEKLHGNRGRGEGNGRGEGKGEGNHGKGHGHGKGND